MDFKLGDTVTWTSQANAGYKRKTGKIIVILPANSKPYSFISEEIFFKYNCAAVDPRSLPRNHRSYLVSIENGNAKPKLYWPRVSLLKIVKD